MKTTRIARWHPVEVPTVKVLALRLVDEKPSPPTMASQNSGIASGKVLLNLI
jgi:hypothetical protein